MLIIIQCLVIINENIKRSIFIALSCKIPSRQLNLLKSFPQSNSKSCYSSIANTRIMGGVRRICMCGNSLRTGNSGSEMMSFAQLSMNSFAQMFAKIQSKAKDQGFFWVRRAAFFNDIKIMLPIFIFRGFFCTNNAVQKWQDNEHSKAYFWYLGGVFRLCCLLIWFFKINRC